MDKKLESALNERLGRLAGAVGFRREGSAAELDRVTPPLDTSVWISDFALLAIVLFLSAKESEMEADVEKASVWMRRRLAKDEGEVGFRDGYIVFVMSRPPDKRLRGLIDRIALDTTVCRKHVVWPSEAGDWSERLQAVTVLGLPVAKDISQRTAVMPSLPAAAERALRLYHKEGSYEAAAEKLRSEAGHFKGGTSSAA